MKKNRLIRRNEMISIILPIYNANKYIRKALDSIMNQTYKEFEVIIIDDGSTDGTGDICKEYTEKYDNVRYIKQLNSGVCAARNRGIVEAKGEYISFCDHDDEYEPRYLEKLIWFALEKKLDMAKCGARFIDIDRNNKLHGEHIETFEDLIVGNVELAKKFLNLPDSYFDVWNGLYKTGFLKESGITFDEKLLYGMEDYDFNTRIVTYITKIGFMKECLYVHYMRMNQSTSGKFKEERIQDIAKYQDVTFKVFEKYKIYLENDWDALSFGKNLIGVIKYSVRGKKGRKKTVEYIKYYSNQFESHLESIKGINTSYKKYSFLALLAKHKCYNSIYFIWIIKFYIKEVILKFRRPKVSMCSPKA